MPRAPRGHRVFFFLYHYRYDINIIRYVCMYIYTIYTTSCTVYSYYSVKKKERRKRKVGPEDPLYLFLE